MSYTDRQHKPKSHQVKFLSFKLISVFVLGCCVMSRPAFEVMISLFHIFCHTISCFILSLTSPLVADPYFLSLCVSCLHDCLPCPDVFHPCPIIPAPLVYFVCSSLGQFDFVGCVQHSSPFPVLVILVSGSLCVFFDLFFAWAFLDCLADLANLLSEIMTF